MKKYFRTALIVICLCVMCYSGYQIYSTYSGYAKAAKSYAQTSEKYVKPVDPPFKATQATEPLNVAPIQVDFDALREENEDVVAWIYCPDTVINYPIVQAEDNDYYLRRMPDGSYNYSGSIFMDYRCDSKFSDYNSIIYGHNMNDDSMFAALGEYLDQEFYDKHPVMYLLTPNQDYQMDVIGAIQTGADSDIYSFPDSQEAFDVYLQLVQEQSQITPKTSPSAVQHTVLLSTCSYEFQDARYLVVGALTPLDRPPEAGK